MSGYSVLQRIAPKARDIAGVGQVKSQKKLSFSSEGFPQGNLIVVFVILILVLQTLTFGILFASYLSTSSSRSVQNIVDEVRTAADISSSILPIDVVELDGSILSTLKNANEIQANVYKDAVPGDYVMIFDGRFIIYRTGEKKVVYDGPSPSQIAADNQNNLIDTIVTVAKSKNIIPTDSVDKPSVSVVTDVELIKKEDPAFYANVKEGDVVAIFQKTNTIVLYRTTTGEIFNNGKISATIAK